MDTVDLNTEKTLDFVEKYHKCPMLWRSSDQNYKNCQMRSNAFQELGTKYLLDFKPILNKTKSLRSYFHCEHAKVLNKKSGFIH